MKVGIVGNGYKIITLKILELRNIKIYGNILKSYLKPEEAEGNYDSSAYPSE